MTLLLLQVAIVLLTTLLCGSIARRLGQGRVIGEILGGILLGPSVFARMAPHAFGTVFPASSLAPFDVLSTLGLILFLFLVGSELDLQRLSEHRGTATLASGMSILLPFLMAALVSHPLRKRFAPQHVGGWPFFLFLGISLSITAFPVLARILEEKHLQATALGATALMCAAFDDVCGWSLLAVALTLIPSGGRAAGSWAATSGGLTMRFVLLLVYLLFMLLVVRPFGQRIARRRRDAAFSYEAMGITAALLLLSAAATDALGVHPLFGAFLAGVCFPRVPRWQAALRARLDMIVSVLLLPLFFALTGMKTRLDLLRGTSIWLWTALLLLLAMVGKIGGGALGARWSGAGWRHSFALGTLLNTRGLVELIVLNIAYSAHVFSPELFTMLVLMALITTSITVPLLNRIGYKVEQPAELVAAD